MRCACDLHIHTCLSPCGDEEMTPNNVVNMARLIGLDVMAVTDHNTSGNVRAVWEAGRRAGVAVVPGMELETSEEVHVLLLFPDCDAAEACGAYVAAHRMPVKNRVDVYGRQILTDADDNVVGEESDLLVVATDIGVYETVALAARFGGVAVPAHIDKPANGILQMLGAVTDDMGFTAVELSPHADDALGREMRRRGYVVIRNSDSHYLETLADSPAYILELDAATPAAVIEALGAPLRPQSTLLR